MASWSGWPYLDRARGSRAQAFRAVSSSRRASAFLWFQYSRADMCLPACLPVGGVKAFQHTQSAESLPPAG